MTTTSKRLFKGSTLRLTTLIMNIGVGFFMMPFLIHSLGDENYGIWILVGTVVGFYGLLDLGMGGAIVRFIVRAMHGKDSNEVNIALSNAVILFAGIGLLSLLVTGFIIFLVPFFIDDVGKVFLVQIIVAILGVKASIIFPISTFRGVLVANYRFDIVSYIKLSSLLIRTAVIVYFISSGHGIVSLALIMAIDAVLSNSITIFMAKRLMPEMDVKLSLFSSEKLKDYYHYGKFTYISTLADRVRFSIDDFVVAGFIGLSAVTHYTIAVMLLNYFTQTMSSIFGVIAPSLNKYHKLGEWDKLREVFLVATELTTIAAILFGGLLLTLGKPFILIWMGPEYDDVYLAIVILTISSVVAGSQRPSVAVLYAIAKHKYYAKITSIEAVFNLIISMVLANYIGIYGVALGTTLPLLVNKLFYQPAYTCKQLELSLKKYYFSLAKYFFLGVVLFASTCKVFTYIDIDTYTELFIFGSLEAVVFILFCLRFVLSNRATDYLRQLLPGKIIFLLRKV